MIWRNRPLLDPLPKPAPGNVVVRLTEGLRLQIDDSDVYLLGAGHTMELPESDAAMMIRNGLAESVREVLLPHLFAKKSPDI